MLPSHPSLGQRSIRSRPKYNTAPTEVLGLRYVQFVGLSSLLLSFIYAYVHSDHSLTSGNRSLRRTSARRTAPSISEPAFNDIVVPTTGDVASPRGCPVCHWQLLRCRFTQSACVQNHDSRSQYGCISQRTRQSLTRPLDSRSFLDLLCLSVSNPSLPNLCTFVHYLRSCGSQPDRRERKASPHFSTTHGP